MCLGRESGDQKKKRTIQTHAFSQNIRQGLIYIKYCLISRFNNFKNSNHIRVQDTEHLSSLFCPIIILFLCFVYLNCKMIHWSHP